MDLLDVFKEYWQIIAFLGGTVAAWAQVLLTLQNHKTRLKEIKEEFATHKTEMKEYMKKVELVESNQGQVLVALAEMKAEMRGDILGLRRDVERVLNSKKQ
jgi:Asp-tRNA(Asn)/Glu-tRNA(Gln) amidotransferase C subunit